MTVALFARTIRGLESVAAHEISGIGTVGSIGHREVHFDAEPARALALGSVDDVFVTLADVDGIGRTKAALDVLAEAASSLDVHDHAERLGRQIRTFDVSASFLGARNYNRFDVEDAVGASVGATTGWEYQRRREDGTTGDATIRAHLRDERALLGLRLAERPLHRRSYKTESPRGSLHPPVAFAMAMLAELRAGLVVLDPACGAGTIPIECARNTPGISAVASDIDASMVGMTERNAARAGVEVHVFVGNAGRSPVAHADRVITNPPWGRAVPRKGGFQHPSSLPEAEVVVMLGEELHLPDEVARIPISLMGAHPEIVVAGDATLARSILG
jgi:23S rRNA G2445 N2-methylase RlmL